MPAAHTPRKSRRPRKGKVARRWIRTASDELAVREGCYVDERYAEIVATFLRTFCVHTKDPFAGQPFVLLPWQYDDIVGPLYSWRRPDGRRRFTELFCQVAKKNGKSSKASGLGLYHLVGDGMQAPEVYINAIDRFNAGSVYDEAERMVLESPGLSARLKPIASRKTIVYPEKYGKLIAASKEVLNKEGLGPSALIFDELHLHRDSRMWRMFRYAMRARPEPMTIVITTAGTAEDVERKSICYRRYEYAKAIAEGRILDIRVLPAIYEAAETDPIDDPATWARANPSLGVTLRAEDFRDDLTDAATDPEQMQEFKQKRLNIWVSARERYIAREDWEACRSKAEPKRLRARCKGRAFYGGLDLANVSDLAAFAALFPDEDGHRLTALVKLWCPSGAIDRRSRRDGVNYRVWADQKWLTATPGRTISYQAIRKYINAFCARYECAALYCDPWNAAKLLEELAETDGLPVVEHRQGYASMSGPTKEFQRLVLDRRLRHPGNPVLDWCVGNLRVESDGAGNVKPSKKRSAEKIDGAVAIIDAVAAWIDADGAAERSVYEDEGLFTLEF